MIGKKRSRSFQSLEIPVRAIVRAMTRREFLAWLSVQPLVATALAGDEGDAALKRDWPGRDEIGSQRFSPGTTNTGHRNFPGPGRGCSHSLRSAGVRRILRRRISGKAGMTISLPKALPVTSGWLPLPSRIVAGGRTLNGEVPDLKLRKTSRGVPRHGRCPQDCHEAFGA